jgi:hypothetical protein
MFGFYDNEKAYDNINKQEIWKTLQRANVSETLTNRIKEIYDRFFNMIMDDIKNKSNRRTGELITKNHGICRRDSYMVTEWKYLREERSKCYHVLSLWIKCKFR